MNRRGFLGSILAACISPAIVRADSLMRIVPMDLPIITMGTIPQAFVGVELFDTAVVPLWLAKAVDPKAMEVCRKGDVPMAELIASCGDFDAREVQKEHRAKFGKPDPMIDRVEILQKIRKARKDGFSTEQYTAPMLGEIGPIWIGDDGTFTIR